MRLNGISLAALTLGMGGLFAVGCGDSSSDDVNVTTGDSDSDGGNGGAGAGSDSDSDGGAGLISNGGSGNSGGLVECAANEAQATLVNKPVDIIFVIDNSGSMSAEIFEVEEQINVNFANIIEAADPPIDYNVIMVTGYGASNVQDVCIAEPLGGNPDANMDGHCDSTGGMPINTANFFHHSPVSSATEGVSSFNALCRLNQTFYTADKFGLNPNGYQDRLREEAFKIFVVITDDDVDTNQADNCNSPQYDDNNQIDGNGVGAAWDADITSLSSIHFGTPAERNYVFYSIIGLAPFDNGDLTLPHPPTAPIITQQCSPSSAGPGTGYQDLSILTGGLRYPTCGLEYTPIFQKIAEGVIEGAQVSCEFEIPEPPMGETLDLETVFVVYTVGGVGNEIEFSQVDGLADCQSGSFYIDTAADTIVLCPDTCDLVQDDPDAGIKIAFGCEADVPV